MPLDPCTAAGLPITITVVANCWRSGLWNGIDGDGMTLETAIHKMSGLPAATLGLEDRGTVAAGQVADLLVFDPARIEDRATFTEPYLKAQGKKVK